VNDPRFRGKRRPEQALEKTAGRRPIVIRPVRSSIDILVVGLCALVRSAGLLRSMTTTRLKIRYRNSRLGWLWAPLQPLALMVLYAVVFSTFRGNSVAALPYPLFLFAGIMLWAFCSTSITTAAAGMLSHQRLMATVYFPREIVPLSYILATLVDLALAAIVLLMMMVGYAIPLSWTVLFGLPILLVLTLLVTAIGLLISAAQVYIRDISVALPMILQVLMFTTPIVYSPTAVPVAVQQLYWLNPFAILVENFRQAVVGGTLPALGGMTYCTTVTIFSFLFAYIVFKKLESTIVDEM
jgi:lipopolysaccharide transport system permease protein